MIVYRGENREAELDWSELEDAKSLRSSELVSLPLATRRAPVGVCINMDSICRKCWHSLQCPLEEQSVLWPFLCLSPEACHFAPLFFLTTYLSWPRSGGPERGRSLEDDDDDGSAARPLRQIEVLIHPGLDFLFSPSRSQHPSLKLHPSRMMSFCAQYVMCHYSQDSRLH